ncbi:histidine kinase [uncultured Methylobacterium sp.]|uniref:helix-turn-helix domain-containing protein n=1 Tax=uncultured Methylobacterium sp. TaxID=157278 RepID=UPI002616C8F2|nr:histidine kinase [uncultured Methylobacterium sp.]
MNAADLDLAPAGFLRLIGPEGLIGTWRWAFATDEHVWSAALFRMLGLDPHRARAGHGLLLGLVHPEDREGWASAGDLRSGRVPRLSTVRVVRPDGGIRVLSIAAELRLAPDARPLGLSAILLDVTEPDGLTRLCREEEGRRQALYRTTLTTTFSLGLDLLHVFPAEVARVHGPTLAEINVDPFVMVVPDEREAFCARGWEAHDRGLPFQGLARERLANGEVWQFRILGVPAWDTDGTYLGRTGLKHPVHGALPATGADRRLTRALEQAVQGYHLRAARGLLDWSMAMLAQASGLSVTTVRRLEENAELQGARSRHSAVEALRRAGIRFIALDDGTIAIARR